MITTYINTHNPSQEYIEMVNITAPVFTDLSILWFLSTRFLKYKPPSQPFNCKDRMYPTWKFELSYYRILWSPVFYKQKHESRPSVLLDALLGYGVTGPRKIRFPFTICCCALENLDLFKRLYKGLFFNLDGRPVSFPLFSGISMR